ncbi:MAG: alpha/beta fold hydrolase [Anaerolineae bacterium]|nr:alpha/beta fold hydrolase [Anaerolineae bacterium]
MQAYKSLYPFESHWMDLNGVRYHYLDEGPRDAAPVVMLHGNPTWSFYYRTLIPQVSETHRVIVPDHMGCGLSDKPQDYPYTLEQHIQNVEALIAHLGLENITLVLHDWGGAIGCGYATRHPENIARLVLFNTSAFYAPTVPLVLRLARSPILGDVMLRGFNAFVLAALVWGTSQPQRFTPAVREGYLAPYNSWDKRIAVLRFVQDIPLEKAHYTRQTINEIDRRLGSLHNRPMQIFWGADDFVFTVKSFLNGWLERFPNAEVHIFEDAGHYVVEDAHERILPHLLRFLSESNVH